MADRNKAQEVGEAIEGAGSALTGCGCLLTIFITIPILLFLFL